VGVLDWLFGTSSEPELAREITSPYPSVGSAIRAYVASRALGGELTLPAVERGVELIASAVAQLALTAYRDGAPLPEQPRITGRPDP
jgi:hypothetical protein